LFDTLRQDQSEVLGITELILNDLFGLLKTGFWGGTPIPARAIETQALDSMIAEAAYYKAGSAIFRQDESYWIGKKPKRKFLSKSRTNGH
jgi:hypothetical protein